MVNKNEIEVKCTESHFSELEGKANATMHYARRVSENITKAHDLICVKNSVDVVSCDEKADDDMIPVNRIIGVQDVVQKTNDSLDDIDIKIHKIIELFK